MNSVSKGTLCDSTSVLIHVSVFHTLYQRFDDYVIQALTSEHFIYIFPNLIRNCMQWKMKLGVYLLISIAMTGFVAKIMNRNLG